MSDVTRAVQEANRARFTTRISFFEQPAIAESLERLAARADVLQLAVLVLSGASSVRTVRPAVMKHVIRDPGTNLITSVVEEDVRLSWNGHASDNGS